ncbi:elongation factor G [Rhodobacteraceae bacterium 2CG4]|uniref:Elongation factor G n=1 Tax=Halovulum marinum TaxID=2662447 RepID=A0A6L5Z5G5_9RHOB|nr:elongation factor G [Halovulum marinum]MSU91667.1 elongation factor G [Halovulum marinum]
MRVFTVIGPSQSGKTTLADALAGLEGRASINEFSDAATLRRFDYLGDAWGCIDIAGGTETLGLAAQAVLASDAAVVVVPPDPDAAVLSAPYLRLVQEADIPAVLFVNRIDAPAGRVRDIVAALQAFCPQPIILRQVPMRSGDSVTGTIDLISERAWQFNEGQRSDLIEMPDTAKEREQEARTELLEHLADFDDALLEQLIEDKRPATDEVFGLAARVLASHEAMPALLGAASHGNGMQRLMKTLRHEVPGPDAARTRLGGAPLAVAFLADVRKHLGKMTVLRALADGVAAGAPLGGAAPGNLTALDARTPVDRVAPGDFAIAVKSDHLAAGTLLTADGAAPAPDWMRRRVPGLRQLVAPLHERDDVRLSGALGKLAETDPALLLEQDPQTGKPILATQGPMHARRVAAKLAEDFGIEIDLAPVPPAYRESITRAVDQHHRHRKQSGGAGQFADVQLQVAPAARGAGFAFDEVVKGGAVPRNYIPAVAAGAEEALAQGPLGFPVVDVAVTLKDGKHHSVDSSDHAFRTAGKAAVREALKQAAPVLLQPIFRVDIHVPAPFSGGLVPVMNGLKGQVLGFEAHPAAYGWDVFSALLPAAALDELQRALGSATQGTAWAEARFDHYTEVYGREAEKLSAALTGEPA